MTTLDASVLIAYFERDDRHHARAVSLLLSAPSFTAHPVTLAECLVGAARLGRAAEQLADVRALRVETPPGDPEEPLRLATLRATTRLKVPDCCVLDVARTHGGVLATFDDELAAAARDLGLTLA